MVRVVELQGARRLEQQVKMVEWADGRSGSASAGIVDAWTRRFGLHAGANEVRPLPWASNRKRRGRMHGDEERGNLHLASSFL